jgi:hypothetical protein
MQFFPIVLAENSVLLLSAVDNSWPLWVNGVEIQAKMRYPCCFLKRKSKAVRDRNDDQASLHPDLHRGMCGLGDMEMA